MKGKLLRISIVDVDQFEVIDRARENDKIIFACRCLCLQAEPAISEAYDALHLCIVEKATALKISDHTK